MPVTRASASAKLILLGEHAVVYGHPAIAIPFTDLRLRVTVEPNIMGSPGSLRVIATDTGRDQLFSDMANNEPIKQMILLLLEFLGVKTPPSCTLRIASDIPLGAGFGSSAALAVGIMRALSAFLGHPLNEKELDTLAYQSDQYIHGRLSGIDTTVIAWEQAIFYQRGRSVSHLRPLNSLAFVIADSGERTPTAESIAYLANRLENESVYVKGKFADIEKQVNIAKRAMSIGDRYMLGDAMNANQTLLADLGLSCPKLGYLVNAARRAGALGAKLTGGGQGGAMIALAEVDHIDAVATALHEAGATAVWKTQLPASQIMAV